MTAPLEKVRIVDTEGNVGEANPMDIKEVPLAGFGTPVVVSMVTGSVVRAYAAAQSARGCIIRPQHADFESGTNAHAVAFDSKPLPVGEETEPAFVVGPIIPPNLVCGQGLLLEDLSLLRFKGTTGDKVVVIPVL